MGPMATSRPAPVSSAGSCPLDPKQKPPSLRLGGFAYCVGPWDRGLAIPADRAPIKASIRIDVDLDIDTASDEQTDGPPGNGMR